MIAAEMDRTDEAAERFYDAACVVSLRLTGVKSHADVAATAFRALDATIADQLRGWTPAHRGRRPTFRRNPFGGFLVADDVMEAFAFAVDAVRALGQKNVAAAAGLAHGPVDEVEDPWSGTNFTGTAVNVAVRLAALAECEGGVLIADSTARILREAGVDGIVSLGYQRVKHGRLHCHLFLDSQRTPIVSPPVPAGDRAVHVAVVAYDLAGYSRLPGDWQARRIRTLRSTVVGTLHRIRGPKEDLHYQAAGDGGVIVAPAARSSDLWRIAMTLNEEARNNQLPLRVGFGEGVAVLDVNGRPVGPALFNAETLCELATTRRACVSAEMWDRQIRERGEQAGWWSWGRRRRDGLIGRLVHPPVRGRGLFGASFAMGVTLMMLLAIFQACREPFHRALTVDDVVYLAHESYKSEDASAIDLKAIAIRIEDPGRLDVETARKVIKPIQARNRQRALAEVYRQFLRREWSPLAGFETCREQGEVFIEYDGASRTWRVAESWTTEHRHRPGLDGDTPAILVVPLLERDLRRDEATDLLVLRKPGDERDIVRLREKDAFGTKSVGDGYDLFFFSANKILRRGGGTVERLEQEDTVNRKWYKPPVQFIRAATPASGNCRSVSARFYISRKDANVPLTPRLAVDYVASEIHPAGPRSVRANTVHCERRDERPEGLERLEGIKDRPIEWTGGWVCEVEVRPGSAEEASRQSILAFRLGLPFTWSPPLDEATSAQPAK